MGIACHIVAHAPIAMILKNKSKVTEAVKGSTPRKAAGLTQTQEGPLSDVENLLMAWEEDQTQRDMGLSSRRIAGQAAFVCSVQTEGWT